VGVGVGAAAFPRRCRRGEIRGANINTRRSASRLFVKGRAPPAVAGVDGRQRGEGGIRLRFGILSTEIELLSGSALSLSLSLSLSLFLSLSFFHLRLHTSIRACRSPSETSLVPTAQFFLRVETKQLYETNASGRLCPVKDERPRGISAGAGNVDEDKK